MNTRYSNNPYDEESISNQLSFQSMEQKSIENHNELLTQNSRNTQIYIKPTEISNFASKGD